MSYWVHNVNTVNLSHTELKEDEKFWSFCRISESSVRTLCIYLVELKLTKQNTN